MRWPWQKRPPVPPALIDLGGGDRLTMTDACDGIAIIGDSGSGKTSGPSQWLTRRLMQEGAGMVFTTAKPGECMRLAGMAREEGQIGRFFRLGEGSPVKIDLLNYALNTLRMLPRDLARMLIVSGETTSREQGGGSDAEFFATAAERLLFHAINAVFLAHGRVSFSDIYRVVTSLPNSPADIASAEWRDSSFLARCLSAIHVRQGDAISAEAGLTAEFFASEMARLSDKTRSCVVTHAQNIVEKFMSGPVAAVLDGGETNFSPEHVMGGAMLVLDFPTLTHHGSGRLAQTFAKMLFQKAVLARAVTPHSRPVVFFQDESPQTLTSWDVDVQMVARQSRLINVHVVQSISAVQHVLGGGAKAEQTAFALLGNLQHKFLCRQSDRVTNDFFAETVGKRRQLFMSGSVAGGEYDPISNRYEPKHGGGFSSGFNETETYDLPAHTFLTLASGGPRHGHQVEAIYFRGGQPFAGGKVWQRLLFPQRY